MIAALMLYALLLSALFTIAAAVLERGCRLLGWQGRWAWALAIVGSLVWPVAAFVGRSEESAATVVPMVGAMMATTSDALRDTLSPLQSLLPGLDTVLAGVWIIASAVVVLALGFDWARQRRDLRQWPAAVIDGVPVRIAPRMGPAVVGCLPGQIVFPEWAAALPSQRRALTVAHEWQHVCSRDAELLHGAAIAVALFAWNPLIWWQRARLRDAIELDCDQRLLRAGIDVGAYGELLIEAVSHTPLAGTVLGLSRRSLMSSLLFRRVALMTRPQPKARGLKATIAAAIGAVCVIAACETPTPTPFEPSSPILVSQNVPVDSADVVEVYGKLLAVREVYGKLLAVRGDSSEVGVAWIGRKVRDERWHVTVRKPEDSSTFELCLKGDPKTGPCVEFMKVVLTAQSRKPDLEAKLIKAKQLVIEEPSGVVGGVVELASTRKPPPPTRR